MLWVLPAVTVLQAMLRFRAICEHGAVTDTSSPLTAARTNLCSDVVAWLLFPHNVHYHLEHHLFVNTPCWNLPRAHALLKSWWPQMEIASGYGEVLQLATSRPDDDRGASGGRKGLSANAL